MIAGGGIAGNVNHARKQKRGGMRALAHPAWLNQ
jgi:hypothetical protein